MQASLLIVCSFALVLTACGAHKDSRPGGSAGGPASLGYEYGDTVNGVKCSTGKHLATQKDVLCQVLGDETLNGKCASEKRKKHFKALGCDPAKTVDIDGFTFGQCGNVSHPNSAEAQCDALTNETLNKNCATEARQAKAKELGCK